MRERGKETEREREGVIVRTEGNKTDKKTEGRSRSLEDGVRRM